MNDDKRKKRLKKKEKVRTKEKSERKSAIKKKLRFLIAGGLNTLVGLGFFPLVYIALKPFEIHYLATLVLSQIFCITFSYLTNKALVFRTKGNYAKEYARFIVFHGGYLMVNLIALPVMVEFFKLGPIIAQALFAILVIITSYTWHSKVTFRSGKADNEI